MNGRRGWVGRAGTRPLHAVGWGLLWIVCVGCEDGARMPDAVFVEEPAGESWASVEARAALDDRGEVVRSSSFGFARGPVWLRVALPPTRVPGVLEVAYPTLDRVDVWVGGDHWRVGDRQPFAERPIAHPTYAFPVAPGERVALVRAQSAGALAVPIRHWTRAAFERHAATMPLGLGFFYGFLLALALYNAFLAVSLRSRAYAYYAIWLGALVLSQAGFAGHTGMWLWPAWPWAINALPTVFLCISAGSGNLFLLAMLDLHRAAPRSAKVIHGLALAFYAAALGLLVAYDVVVPVVLALGIADIATLAVVLVAAVRRRQRAAYFLAFGALCFLPWYGVFALATQGLIPMGFWVRHGLKVGTCLEALILAFALADRVRILERAKLAAQRALSRGLLVAQDDERRRVACELHDGVGQSLTALSAVLDGEPGERARECVEEVRRVAHELHPDRLDRLGLRAACERVVEETLDRAGLEYEHELSNIDDRVAPPVALHVYRVLQEALTNVVRHAEASWARVTLGREDRWVVLRVEDDGRGLGDGPRGLGLSSMEARARASEGRIVIGAGAAGGTVVALFVPTWEAA
ncbi:MAG: hypothetical protein EVA89_25435 [Sandaracinaceae bacterium]|nr:MAG: hypothetical protein EVA89_25435 [Sandaracinaceae bacterium]